MVEQYKANTYMFENDQIAQLSLCALRDATPYQFCRFFNIVAVDPAPLRFKHLGCKLFLQAL